MKWIIAGGMLMLAGSAAAVGGGSHDIYAQSLLHPAQVAEPLVADLAIIAMPAGARAPVVMASTDRSAVGHAVPAAATAGVPAEGYFESGARRAQVTLPLLDVGGEVIGALQVGFASPGLPRAALLDRARAVQHWLGRRVSHLANLSDPFPYDVGARLHTRAQALTEEVMAAHPEIEIFAIHATPPDSDYNVIAGSNIGRLGKKADNDDMRCVYTGKPNLEVNASGKRFEVEMQLHDRSGAVIGALGVVYAYHDGADKEALHRAADQLRLSIEKRIASAEWLFEAPGMAPPLKLVGRTELPGYKGDFDHFEVDAARNRLLLAAEDHGTLEIFDLGTGRHLKSIKGLDTPHSPYLVPGTSRLLVADGSESIKVLDAETYARKGEIKTHPGADSIGVDPTSGHLLVVTGGKDVKLNESWLEEIDPMTGEHVAETHLDSNHVEAMAVEPDGARIYINLTDKNQLAVIDRVHHAVVAQWPIREAEQNAMVQLDPESRQLLVVTRRPGKLLVLDAATGATRAVLDGPGRSDQELFDAANRRVYVPGGDGKVAVYELDDDASVRALGSVASAIGAKTGVLIPQLRRLYLAVSPGEGKTGAGIVWMDVAPRQ